MSAQRQGWVLCPTELLEPTPAHLCWVPSSCPTWPLLCDPSVGGPPTVEPWPLPEQGRKFCGKESLPAILRRYGVQHWLWVVGVMGPLQNHLLPHDLSFCFQDIRYCLGGPAGSDEALADVATLSGPFRSSCQGAGQGSGWNTTLGAQAAPTPEDLCHNYPSELPPSGPREEVL